MCIVLYLHLGLPGRVCHVPELLPRAAFRGGARLHVYCIVSLVLYLHLGLHVYCIVSPPRVTRPSLPCT